MGAYASDESEPGRDLQDMDLQSTNYNLKIIFSTTKIIIE